MKRPRILLTAIAAMGLAASLFAAPVSAGVTTNAAVTILHGIPGATVDVCVGKNPIREDFRYGRHFQVSLPPGTYPIRVRLQGHGACKGALVIKQSVTVSEGLNATAIAVIKGGTPQLALYVNNVDAIDTRPLLSAIHEAKAPAVDLWIASPTSLAAAPVPTIADVTRGAQAGPVPVPSDAYAVWASLAGTVTPVIGPIVAELGDSHAYSIVAIGTHPGNYRLVTLDLGPTI